MRIACVVINNLPVQVELCHNPDWRGQPLVIGGLPFEDKPVLDASPEAAASGVARVMSLRQAYALCPEAKFLPADGKRYEQAYEEVLSVLENFSPIIDAEKPGCACLDVAGVQNEAVLTRDMVSRIRADTRLDATAGISGGKFFAHAAALVATPEASVILAPGRERDFIASFSIDLLPCSDEAKERLRFLGIRFISQLSRFPREMLVTQFGSEGMTLHNLSHGIDPTPLIPRKKPQIVEDTIEFDPPIDSYLDILRAGDAVLGKLLADVKAHGKLCREITVRLSFASGTQEAQRLPLKEATIASDVIVRRLETWLESREFPAPVSGMTISLWLTKEPGKHPTLWPHERVRRELDRLTGELKLRFGYQPLKQIVIKDPTAFIPERRFALKDASEREAVE
ncbi:MAG: hypothetical protein HY670_10630 [Chloroflexi bacterium]|nr:hypothetical protein [Chloroflexota bacterium]